MNKRTIDINIEAHQLDCGNQNDTSKKGHIFAVHYPGILERCVACKVYKYKWVQFKLGKKILIVDSNDLKQYEH